MPTASGVNEGIISNYFVEVFPGDRLNDLIGEAKLRFITEFGDDVINNPALAMFFRDEPHFTMMCARTGNLKALKTALMDVAQKYERFPFTIIGTELERKGGLEEFHTMVDNTAMMNFRRVHADVLAASLPHNTAGFYERFNPDVLGSEARANLEHNGFPGSRKLFKPHASIGRFHPDFIDDTKSEFAQQRPAIQRLLVEYDKKFDGTYETGDLQLRQLPFDTAAAREKAGVGDQIPVDPTATPFGKTVFPFANFD